MISSLEFHRDKQGNARAIWSGKDPAGSLLAQFFEAELGADTAYCDRLLAEAEKHHQGHSAAWKTSGNAFAVEIDGAKVNIRPLFGADQHHSYTAELPEFLALLQTWRKLVG